MQITVQIVKQPAAMLFSTTGDHEDDLACCFPSISNVCSSRMQIKTTRGSW